MDFPILNINSGIFGDVSLTLLNHHMTKHFSLAYSHHLYTLGQAYLAFIAINTPSETWWRSSFWMSLKDIHSRFLNLLERCKAKRVQGFLFTYYFCFTNNHEDVWLCMCIYVWRKSFLYCKVLRGIQSSPGIPHPYIQIPTCRTEHCYAGSLWSRAKGSFCPNWNCILLKCFTSNQVIVNCSF